MADFTGGLEDRRHYRSGQRRDRRIGCSHGADATLKACREASYGVAPLTGYQSLDFKSTDLSSAQPLGDDPLLGRGRNAQDPYRGLITDEGQLDIPLDLRGTGFWLTGLFGDPVTTPSNASGSIVFAVNPTAGDTITLNGTVWTFVSGTAGAEETQIQGTVTQTVDQLVSDLNASGDPEIAKCTYSRPTSTQTLVIAFDTAGPSGNGFTIAASAASVSSPTLTGGGYSHVWESGADDIPSYTIEVGHPKLTTPVFFRHLGTGQCQKDCTASDGSALRVKPGHAPSPQTRKSVPIFSLIARGDPPRSDDVRSLPAIAA